MTRTPHLGRKLKHVARYVGRESESESEARPYARVWVPRVPAPRRVWLSVRGPRDIRPYAFAWLGAQNFLVWAARPMLSHLWAARTRLGSQSASSGIPDASPEKSGRMSGLGTSPPCAHFARGCQTRPGPDIWEWTSPGVETTQTPAKLVWEMLWGPRPEHKDGPYCRLTSLVRVLCVLV